MFIKVRLFVLLIFVCGVIRGLFLGGVFGFKFGIVYYLRRLKMLILLYIKFKYRV